MTGRTFAFAFDLDVEWRFANNLFRLREAKGWNRPASELAFRKVPRRATFWERWPALGGGEATAAASETSEWGKAFLR